MTMTKKKVFLIVAQPTGDEKYHKPIFSPYLTTFFLALESQSSLFLSLSTMFSISTCSLFVLLRPAHCCGCFFWVFYLFVTCSTSVNDQRMVKCLLLSPQKSRRQSHDHYRVVGYSNGPTNKSMNSVLNSKDPSSACGQIKHFLIFGKPHQETASKAGQIHTEKWISDLLPN